MLILCNRLTPLGEVLDKVQRRGQQMNGCISWRFMVVMAEMLWVVLQLLNSIGSIIR